MERHVCVCVEGKGARPGLTLLLSIYWNIIKAYKIVGKPGKLISLFSVFLLDCTLCQNCQLCQQLYVAI